MDGMAKRRLLNSMGIQLWRERSVPSPDAAGESACLPEPVQSTLRIPDMDWSELQTTAANCQACALHRGRNQVVFGSGSQSADWLFVGEGPGAEEDRQGQPFVGRAGQLLTAMLKAIGLRRSQVYIANVVKCRPPENRNPTPDEMEACAPLLKRQIELLKPRVIVALGGVAANH
ncbi:MAG: uracil-DNA glycosylase, partial [Gammaproteobacteria bacterium]|nr:uracil-DNA glycosylase [Gammaproteobacteria bacterium]